MILCGVSLLRHSAATLFRRCSASAGDEVRGRDAVLDLAYDFDAEVVEAAAQWELWRLAWKRRSRRRTGRTG